MGFLSDVKTDQRPAADDNESQARQRARRRLIGAGVLLAAGVIGFPLLFETKPRPVSADVPAVQASRDRSVAAASPARVVERAPPASTGAVAASAVPAASAPATAATRAPDARVEIAIPPAAAVDAKRAAQDKDKDKDKEKAEPERAARDQAKTPPTTPTSDRFVVQVGAYASDAGVRDVRSRLERVGLKSYTQIVRSGGASSTRVRVGPYASRQEAERAVEKARSIGLKANIVPQTQGKAPQAR